MKSVRVAVACFLVFGLASCEEPKPETSILGRWEDKDRNPLEFRTDGTVAGNMRMGRLTLTVDGTYRFVDEQTMVIETANAVLPKRTITFKINRLDFHELSLTASNGIMTLWTRPPTP